MLTHDVAQRWFGFIGIAVMLAILIVLGLRAAFERITRDIDAIEDEIGALDAMGRALDRGTDTVHRSMDHVSEGWTPLNPSRAGGPQARRRQP